MENAAGAVRQIPHWVRSFGQNRAGGVRTLIVVLFVAQSYAVVGLSAYWARPAFRGGHWAALLLDLTAMLISVAAVIWLCVPGWGGAWLDRYTRAHSEVGTTARMKPPGWLMVAALAGCIAAHGLLAVFEVIPPKLMQPASALYIVPFLTFGILSQRPGGSLLLLWPVLYGLHAVLILAGVPIVFGGRWDSLNLFLPSAAYGLLAGAGALLYSRLALYRIQRMARS